MPATGPSARPRDSFAQLRAVPPPPKRGDLSAASPLSRASRSSRGVGRAEPSAPRVGLTAEGRWLGLAGLVFILSGAALSAVGVAALGAFVLVLMAAAHVYAVLASHRIATAKVPLDGKADGALKLWEGRSTSVNLSLLLPKTIAVHSIDLVPSLSESLEGKLELAEDDGTAPPEALRDPDAALSYTLELRGLRLGDAWLQGFDLAATVALGLYSVRAFVPCLLRATVLPRHMSSAQPPLRATRAAADEQADLVHRERRGFGMEIRELRDFQAGDPFKHIAWSASARRGKLIAREFESDLQLSIWLLVDCSPSMFWGPPGAAKIDHALDIAADLSRSLSSGRDRVGLVLHDHETRLVIEPGHGAAHLARLTQALLEVPHLVHEDRTELTDIELVQRVARWFELHEGRTFYLAVPLPPSDTNRSSDPAPAGRERPAPVDLRNDGPACGGPGPPLPRAASAGAARRRAGLGAGGA